MCTSVKPAVCELSNICSLKVYHRQQKLLWSAKVKFSCYIYCFVSVTSIQLKGGWMDEWMDGWMDG